MRIGRSSTVAERKSPGPLERDLLILLALDAEDGWGRDDWLARAAGAGSFAAHRRKHTSESFKAIAAALASAGVVFVTRPAIISPSRRSPRSCTSMRRRRELAFAYCRPVAIVGGEEDPKPMAAARSTSTRSWRFSRTIRTERHGALATLPPKADESEPPHRSARRSSASMSARSCGRPAARLFARAQTFR